jgi:hypothetical protein
MEITLHPTLPSRILVGYRNPSAGPLADPNGAQQVLVGMVKGTFVADEPNPALAERQVPIFDQDIFFNLVRNGDFTEGEQAADGTIISPVAAWTSSSDGPTISRVEVPAPPATLMRVEGAGRVTQPVASGRPLGGRTFALSFRVRSSVNAMLSGIRLETESGAAILGGNRNLTPAFAQFSSVATWPADVEETEALLVLSGHASATVDYDWVRLNEGNAVLPPDPNDPVRYEHDLAIDKPRADVVVLGAPAPPVPGPLGNSWREQVVIGGATMTAVFSGGLMTSFDGAAVAPGAIPWATTTPITVGWQSRAAGTRNAYAGTDLDDFDGSTMKLPRNFDNRFFDGGFYTASGQPFFGHIAAALVTVRTEGDYPAGGGGVETIAVQALLRVPPAPHMSILYRSAAAPDAPLNSVDVPMRLDTLVYDKAAREFYAVWRGIWAALEAVGAERIASVTLS